FQSLVKKDRNFFESFDVVFVDEAHKTGAASIKKILEKCVNTKVRFGLSGTMKDNGSADFFTLQAFLGPLVFKVSPNFLFKNKYATTVNIKVIRLDYLPEEIKNKLYTIRTNKTDKVDGSVVYNLEKQVVVDNKKRFTFITDYISKVSKNSLVLFNDVKNKY